MEKETCLKRKVVDAAEAVKRKVKKIRNIEMDNKNVLENVFEPITNPLYKLLDTNKYNNLNDPSLPAIKFKNEDIVESFNESDMKKTQLKSNPIPTNDYKDISNENTDEDEEEIENSSDLSNESFRTIESALSSPCHQISSWSLSSEAYEDVPFGVRNNKGKLMMGSARVNVTDEIISIAGRSYKNTAGLTELLFKKLPNLDIVTLEDTENYKMMLLETNAHRRDYDPSKPIKSNKGRKYLHVIKPLFSSRKISSSTDGSLPHGSGLPLMKTWKKDVDFVYWDDPNELVSRLKLLIASRNAGNTGVDNEIISIIEELRECGIINSK